MFSWTKKKDEPEEQKEEEAKEINVSAISMVGDLPATSEGSKKPRLSFRGATASARSSIALEPPPTGDTYRSPEEMMKSLSEVDNEISKVDEFNDGRTEEEILKGSALFQ